MPLNACFRNMNLEETVNFLAEEFDIPRSVYVREGGKSVAELRD